MVEINDIFLTPNKAWQDKAFNLDPYAIPIEYVGVQVKVIRVVDKDFVEVTNYVDSSKIVELKHLIPIDQSKLKINDLVSIRQDGLLLMDRVNWGRNFPSSASSFKGKIGKITSFSLTSCQVTWVESTKSNTFLYSALIPYIKEPINERVSTHVVNRESFYELFKKLEGDMGYVYVVSRTPIDMTKKSKNVILYFSEDKTQVTLLYPDREPITLKTQKDMLKAYKEYIIEKNKRFRGLLIDQETFKIKLKEHVFSWKKSFGDADTKLLTNVEYYIEQYVKQINQESEILTQAKEMVDYFQVLDNIEELAHVKRPRPLIEALETNVKNRTYYTGRIDAAFKGKEFREKERREIVKRIEETGRGLDEVSVKEYEAIKDLYDHKIIEEFGLDERGFLYVLFSPLILTYNRLKSCPEHGPKCTCLKEKRHYYYLGRVRVSFHTQIKCDRTTSCKGFGFKSLTYPNSPIHPHLRSDNDCDDGCFHGYDELRRKLLVGGSFSSLIMFIRQFLTNHNPHHGLLSIETFNFCKIVNRKAPSTVKDETFDIKFIEKMFGKLTEKNMNIKEETLKVILKEEALV